MQERAAFRVLYVGSERALLESSTASIVPVRWNAERSEIVYAEQIFLDTLAIHNGPVFAANKKPGRPIDTAASAGDWLLIPEVPHLKSHDPRYPSMSIDGPIAYARKRGLRSALVFHDILPLTNPELNDATDVKAAAAERRDFRKLRARIIGSRSSPTGFIVYGSVVMQMAEELRISHEIVATPRCHRTSGGTHRPGPASS